MSFSTIISAAVEGLNVELIRVEADVSNGLPVFRMVGYLSSEVKEASERVRTAIRNSGFIFPAKRTVINLSPATVRKRGASFDLPIAAAILLSLGELEKSPEGNCLIIGELGLDGKSPESAGDPSDCNGSESTRHHKVRRTGRKCAGGDACARDGSSGSEEPGGNGGYSKWKKEAPAGEDTEEERFRREASGG